MSARAVLAAPPSPGASVRAAAGLMTGTVVLTLASAIAIIATVPWPVGGISVRLAHHAFDAAQSLALGMIVAASSPATAGCASCPSCSPWAAGNLSDADLGTAAQSGRDNSARMRVHNP
jgi:hypothetical protein